jgi:D-alanine-D-alanine ligase
MSRIETQTRSIAAANAGRHARDGGGADHELSARRQPSRGALKALRVAVLCDRNLIPPEDISGKSEAEIASFRTELDVITALKDLGHEVDAVGVFDDLGQLRETLIDRKPHVAFNLLEGFKDYHGFDQHVVSFLELMDQSYTGCNPRGLTIARDKALTKKIMAYHRIRVPAFAVFPKGRRVKRPARLHFPLLVKSVNVEGSVGISQASIVHDDDKLRDRVQYIHEALGTSAIAEQFIDGREIYVGVMGNKRLQTLPPWELIFENAPPEMTVVATEQAKWNLAYQKRWGVTTREADDLSKERQVEFSKLSERIYRVLGLTGYARMDYRLTPQGELYLLEANPNPNIAREEDFALSARAAGIQYDDLLQKVLTLGLRYHPMSNS